MAENRDFLASLRGTLIAWGVPIAAMVAVIGVPHPVKTWVWVAALGWMGAACLWNARRCGRAHCYWTGPFFLLMTLPVLAHGYGLLPLGSGGWKWLGAAIGLGAFGLTAWSERSGRYLR